MFRFLLGRRMAADEDEEAVGGDAAAQKGDAASGDESDDVDEGSTGSAVRLEDVLLQLTEAEQREDDDALRASFSGVSEEDRLVLMQFLPQLELLKDDKKSKGFAEKDSSTDPNPPPFTNGFSEPESQLSSLSDDFAQQEAPLPSFANGFAEQEPSLMNKPLPASTDDAAEAEPLSMKQPQPASPDDAAEAEPSLMKQAQPAFPDDAAEAEPSLMKQPQPASTDDAAEAEPSLIKQPQPSSTDDAAEAEPSLMKQPQPTSSDDAAEAEPSPETEPLPHVTDNLAEQEEDPPEAADPLPPLSNPIPLPSHESKSEPHRGGKTEESDKLDAIMKELKSIKRQQTITHCLVSALIFVTAIWQVSEASMVLSVKDKVTHPFRAIGGFLSRALLGGEKQRILDSVPSPPTIPRMDVTQLAHIKFPELSHSHMLLPSAVVESVDT